MHQKNVWEFFLSRSFEVIFLKKKVEFWIGGLVKRTDISKRARIRLYKHRVEWGGSETFLSQASETCKQTQTLYLFWQSKAIYGVLRSAGSCVTGASLFKDAVISLIEQQFWYLQAKILFHWWAIRCVFKQKRNYESVILPKPVQGKLIVLSCSRVLELALWNKGLGDFASQNIKTKNVKTTKWRQMPKLLLIRCDKICYLTSYRYEYNFIIGVSKKDIRVKM